MVGAAFCCLLCLKLAQAATINVQSSPYNATGNGSTDDRRAILAALIQGCASGNAVYFPAGTYWVSAPLDWVKGCDMTLYGDGSSSSIVKLGGPGSSIYTPLFAFGLPSSTLVFHDLGLYGQNVGAVGLQIESITNVSIYNVVIKDFGTPGYAEGHQVARDGLYARFVENMTVTNSLLNGNERMGVETMGVHTLSVSGSILNGNGSMAGVAEQVVGDTDGPLYVEFLNNIARNNGGGGFDAETATTLPNVHGKIHGNYIENNGNDDWLWGWGAVLGYHSYGEISGNVVNNFAQIAGATDYRSAIVATPLDTLTLTDNYASNAGGYGILVAGRGFRATITGNWSTGNAQWGMDVYSVPNGTITNNIVYGNTSGNLTIADCSGCVTTPNRTSGPPADTTAPSVPTGLTASVASRDQINLSWNVSTDNIGVKGYKVFRDGIEIAVTAGNQYPDTGLSAGATYTYTVAAFDGSGNVSAQSPGTTVTTLKGQDPAASACDVNGDNATNVVDVQLEVNAALGVTMCSPVYDINKDGVCNVIDVQRVVNAALGGPCVSP